MIDEIKKTIKQTRLFVLRQKGHRIMWRQYHLAILVGAIVSLVFLILMFSFLMWFINLVLGK